MEVDHILKMIREGIKIKDFFNYDGTMIPLRPLTSFELDDARWHGYEFASPKLARLLVNIKLGKYKILDELKDYPAELYANIDKFDAEIEYWMVFYSMKDFRDDSFTIDDVRKMRYVHEMARFILDMSSAPRDVVLEIIKTPEGEELAKIIYQYNVPLVNEVRDLTDLQHEFLIWSHPKAPRKVANSMEEFEKLLPQLGRIAHGK